MSSEYRFFANNKFIYKYVMLDDKFGIRKQKALKLVSGLTDKNEIKEKLLKYLFMEGLEYAIQEYKIAENLADEYVEIAKEENAIEILIKYILKQECYIFISDAIQHKIHHFIQRQHNDNEELVYNRVTKIQSFIHFLVQEEKGELKYL